MSVSLLTSLQTMNYLKVLCPWAENLTQSDTQYIKTEYVTMGYNSDKKYAPGGTRLKPV